MLFLDVLKENELPYLNKLEFEKGEIIAQEGDSCDKVFLLREGRIKISSYTLSGEEIVYNVLNKGEIFGNNLLFSSDPSYRGNVIGLSKGSLYIIYKDDLLFLIQENKEFALAYLKAQSDFGKGLNAKLKLLSFNKAEDRFYFYLQMHGGKVSYSSLSSLADSLFLKRETLSRLVHLQERQGKIVIKNKMILLKEE